MVPELVPEPAEGLSMGQYPIHDVAPSAVRIADAIDTMICTTNLVVSFFVIIPSFLYCWGQSPRLINYRPRDNRPQDLMG